MRKLTSTNALNEKLINDSCGMGRALNVIGGRWKPAILYKLNNSTMRYSELKKSITGISERMLVAQLRELEEDQVIERIVYPEIPPRVEYRMTELGKTMGPMLEAMSDWGDIHRERVADKYAASANSQD
ncbi:helix-turn-helix domain-containing protein [Chitinophaga sp. S165]|uniref:winged helix-turn-helix transcriptional regulator n=1 Tax=Chitinophaga sp. S165 TaxID=2135462 RepID=UPI000D719CAD|nr:helix-turn-helix domain-containing protein [Chitinophaga sp. S165]PWV46462.1 HxlR family transcriptional regulator [Chitinophaga sp. S165]